MKRKNKSKVDKNDNIAMQIAITEAVITNLTNYKGYNESYNIDLQKELEHLEELKLKYPEYFI